MTAAAFAVMLFAGVPIAVVLILSGLVYVMVSGNAQLLGSLTQQMFGGVETYGLLAIPLFMLAGELMNEGGLTKRLVNAARVFVGGFRGGLAYINLVANMFMAAIIGSATSQIAVMSRAMVPAMEQEGYERPFAAATTAAGGLLSPIIPPSMLFVIYGVLAQVPISDMFIAGIIPGLILSGFFVIVVAVVGLTRDFPKSDWYTLREAGHALWQALPAALIPIIIVGGILFGVATPTESAALASAIAFAIGYFGSGEIKLKNLPEVLCRTAANASMVVFLVAAANVFGVVIVYEGLPQALAAALTQVTENPFVFLLIVNVCLLLIGMIIDGVSGLVLVVPILLPIATLQFGIDPVQFGVIIAINLTLGLLTPPVGAGLYVAAAMSEAPAFAIFRELLPFLALVAVVLLMLSYWPVLTLGLL
ncbi:MAG: TRAP transporter large permease [Devosiaceae bacterium]|nr:TRAP transporter large permease [Devosiaceae bacterium MH13]